MRQVGQLYCILQQVTAFIFVIVGCTPPSDLQNRHEIRFHKIGKIPVVEGRINGKKAYFIIDTGASISILNQSASAHFGFDLHYTDQHIVGFSGQSNINAVKNCIVEVGMVKVSGIVFKTRCLDELMITIRSQEGIEIAGILGADVLSRYNITINFRSGKLTF